MGINTTRIGLTPVVISPPGQERSRSPTSQPAARCSSSTCAKAPSKHRVWKQWSRAKRREPFLEEGAILAGAPVLLGCGSKASAPPLLDPFRVEGIDLGVMGGQDVLPILGDTAQRCHHLLKIDEVAEGNLPLDIGGQERGIARDDGGA